jgi:predicted DNA-binding protein with PD1-like motif
VSFTEGASGGDTALRRNLMRAQRSGNEHILIFDPDDEVLETFTRYLVEQRVAAGRFQAIGAFKQFQLRYFDTATMHYHARDFDQQVEVLSLVGNVSLRDHQPFIHSHIVIGTADYQALGGHLARGIVEPTLEMILTVLDTELVREKDQRTGLDLIRLR